MRGRDQHTLGIGGGERVGVDAGRSHRDRHDLHPRSPCLARGIDVRRVLHGERADALLDQDREQERHGLGEPVARDDVRRRRPRATHSIEVLREGCRELRCTSALDVAQSIVGACRAPNAASAAMRPAETARRRAGHTGSPRSGRFAATSQAWPRDRRAPTDILRDPRVPAGAGSRGSPRPSVVGRPRPPRRVDTQVVGETP